MANTSGSRSNSSSSVWGGQSPFLKDLYQRGADMLNNFQPNQQIGGAATQAWQQQLQPQANPYLNDMTQVYRDQLGQLDQGAGRGAVGAGVFGGGRQGVEQHLNQQAVGAQMGQFLGNQYQADQARSLTAANMGPQMLGMTDYGQRAGALGNYAGLIGGPTVLGQGSSSSRSIGVASK